MTHILKNPCLFLKTLNKLPPPLLRNSFQCTIECPDLQMHDVVLQQHHSRQKTDTEGHRDSWVDRWLFTPGRDKIYLSQLLQRATKHPEWPHPPRTFCLPASLRSGSGSETWIQTDTHIISSPWLWKKCCKHHDNYQVQYCGHYNNCSYRFIIFYPWQWIKAATRDCC